MIEVISFKRRKANKDHICDWCELPIHKGELYEYEFLKYDGITYSWKNHIKCRVLTSKLNMFDLCDEGLTGESFQEYVRDEYMQLNQIHLDDEKFKYPEFSEQLDFVINHYIKNK